MTKGKGESFEELVREYFSRRGFLAVRSVMFQFENDDVTDVDIWLYGKQASGFRMHGIVDAKNKKSPKAFERILWVKGLQAITRSDRAFVATTDKNPKVSAFGERNGVLVLNKPFLQKYVDAGNGGRLTLEEFESHIKQFQSWKSDGDWLKTISRVKSAAASASPYPAFNIATVAFSFFGERLQTRPMYAEQALRCTVLAAAFACIALDRALEPLQFSDEVARGQSISNGLAFGDSGDGRVLKSIKSVLDVVQDHVENGRAVAARVRGFFERLPTTVRADIIAEHFRSEHRSQRLFQVARELERYAFRAMDAPVELSVDARATLGVLADYCEVDRRLLLPVLTSNGDPTPNSVSAAEQLTVSSSPETPPEPEQKLL